MINCILLIACSKEEQENSKKEIVATIVKLPEQGPIPSYSIYTWEEDKENNELIILGKNLFNATSVIIGNKKFDAISSNDGTSVRAFLNVELGTNAQSIWLNFDNKTAQLNERYIPNKDDFPDYDDVSLTDDVVAFEAFEEELSCGIDLESEGAIMIEGRLRNYKARSTFPSVSIGKSIIPIEQFIIKGDTLKGYITNAQAKRLENGLPIMFDGGNGYKKVSNLRFQFP